MKEYKNTISLEIANKIGEKILSGELQEGVKLKILDISNEYNVSQTVAREALLILGKSYLVEHFPRKGTFVRMVKKSDALDLYEIKKRLLGYAVQCVCNDYGKKPETKKALIKCYEDLLHALQEGDAEKAHRANMILSETLVDSLDNIFLRESLNNIEYQTKRFHIHNAFLTETGRLISAYHISLLLKTQDEPLLAEKCMVDYLDAVKPFVFSEHLEEA